MRDGSVAGERLAEESRGHARRRPRAALHADTDEEERRHEKDAGGRCEDDVCTGGCQEQSSDRRAEKDPHALDRRQYEVGGGELLR